ncbi:MAG: thiol reductase thioredoxin, partial [Anaerolineae bacterium]|nr:thiol reductase thioredoxin [Anaerolineae bacterium]
MVGPVVEQVAQEHAGRLKVVMMDVDTNPNTPQRLGIMSIPALILFRDGTEVTRLIGFRPREALIETLSLYI